MPRKSPAVKVLTAAVLASRVAYGAAAQVPLRGLGAREVALHGAALVSFLHGSAVRPFLAASIAGDLGDIGATTLAREGLPDGSAPATAAVAGGSPLLTTLVAALVE